MLLSSRYGAGLLFCLVNLVTRIFPQAQKITLTSRAFHNDALGEYAKFLTEYFGYERMLPMNTGVEAVETALKLARRWAYDIKGVPNNQVCRCNRIGRL